MGDSSEAGRIRATFARAGLWFLGLAAAWILVQDERSRRSKAFWFRSSLGEVTVSSGAIRSLARRAALKTNGARLSRVRATVSSGRGGLIIGLRCSADPPGSPVDACRQVRHAVRRRIQHFLGVAPREVRVSILPAREGHRA